MVDSLMVLGKLLFSALLGGLVGIEREFNRKLRSEIPIGVRTMIFITVFGAVTVIMAELMNNNLMVLIGFSGLILFAALSYYARYREYKQRGLTTYTASIIMYLTGLLVGFNEFLIGVIIAVITAAVLSLKTEIHQLAKGMSRKELKAAILFVIIALVILPLLPNKPIDYFGIFNPFQFWYLVVFISAISFVSYLFLKTYQQGLSVTGFLGGFLNCKVTVLQLSNHVKKHPKVRQQAFNGSLLSIAANMISLLIITLLSSGDLRVFIEVMVPLMMSSGIALLFFVKRVSNKSTEDLNVTSPFSLINALKMAFMIFLFMQGTYLIAHFIHPSLVYPAIIVSSFISLFASTASINALYLSGVINAGTLINLLIISAAVIISTKLLFAWLGGDRKLFKQLVKPLVLWSGLLMGYFIIMNYFAIHLIA